MIDQVLTIDQVRQLQELGFNVKKYASMAWLEKTPFIPIEQPKEYELEILTDSLIGNRGNLDVIPTLTIGDIIKVLPVMIGVYSIDFDFIGNQVYVDYIYKGESLPKLEHIWHQNNRDSVISNLIIALFNILKWCIVNKRISKCKK